MDRPNCVNRCEFLRFGEGSFYCKFYDKINLHSEIKTSEDGDDLLVYRCQDCIDEGQIGNNTLEEKIRKTKQMLGWLMDSFYSFKDDFETELTDVFRTLKEIEKDQKDEC